MVKINFLQFSPDLSNFLQLKPILSTGEDFLAAEGAALEATFKLVNQSKSVMSCNFRHSDILFVCSSQEGDHYDGI